MDFVCIKDPVTKLKSRPQPFDYKQLSLFKGLSISINLKFRHKPQSWTWSEKLWTRVHPCSQLEALKIITWDNDDWHEVTWLLCDRMSFVIPKKILEIAVWFEMRDFPKLIHKTWLPKKIGHAS